VFDRCDSYRLRIALNRWWGFGGGSKSLYGGVSQKSFPSAFSEVRFSVVPPLLVAPPNRSPRQRLYTPSPVKELPKGTGGLRRLPPLDLGDGGLETTHEG
jgi:hypothetical protein